MLIFPGRNNRKWVVEKFKGEKIVFKEISDNNMSKASGAKHLPQTKWCCGFLRCIIFQTTTHIRRKKNRPKGGCIENWREKKKDSHSQTRARFKKVKLMRLQTNQIKEIGSFRLDDRKSWDTNSNSTANWFREIILIDHIISNKNWVVM